jgi:hypothetical protein
MQFRLTHLLLAGVLVSCFVADVRLMLRPRENWADAAKTLVNNSAACIIYEPEDSKRLYTFFEPTLKSRLCNPNATRVIVAISPYLDSTKLKELSMTRFHRADIIYDEGPRLIEYDRAPN